MAGARVMIVGLDGASFQVMQPWLERGYLPALRRLMEQGSWGNLESTVPPMTFPAWTSFMTGVSPGRHGILDFTERLPRSHRVRLVSAERRAAPTMWRHLSDCGKRVAVLSVPCTYPPEAVNGVAISGFDAPGVGVEGAMADRSCMYPPALYDEVRSQLGGHPLSSDVHRLLDAGDTEGAVRTILGTLSRKARTAQYVLAKEAWDCFTVVFGESDLIAHHFWRYHDPDSPFRPSVVTDHQAEAVREVYCRLDGILGELLAAAGEDVTVVVMSDHGFGGAGRRAIYLNRWLSKRGLLAFRKSGRGGGVSRLIAAAQRRMVVSLPGWLKRLLARQRALVERATMMARFDGIDWSRTAAYCEEVPYVTSVWVNLKGREPEGIVEPGAEYERIRQRVIEELRQWRDTETGEPVVTAAMPREEVYHGPCTERAADVIVRWNTPGGYSYLFRQSWESEDGSPMRTLPLAALERELSLNKSGGHRPEGIFIMAGPGVKAGQRIAGARIVDVAPTVLLLMGVEVPDLDGRPLREALEEGYPDPQESVPAGPAREGAAEPRQTGYSAEEEARIAERLRGMGYL